MQSTRDFISGLIQEQSATTIAVAVFVITAAILFMYRPFSQAEVGDSALYDYLAQEIVRGHLPYRDVVEIKTPGSFYLSALVMKAGSFLAVRDVIAARMLHIVMAGLLSAIVFVVGEVFFRDRLAGLIGALAPLMSDHYANWTAGGGQPKLPMILFGMLALLLIGKGRPFWAGFCSMLSCLCWQPGLLFTATAVLVFSNYLTRWRDLRALKVLIGASIPLLVMVLYFHSKGALRDLWTWTIAFNYGVNAQHTLRTTSESLSHFLGVSLRVFGLWFILLALSISGFVLTAIDRLQARIEHGLQVSASESYQDSILIAPLVYVGFCLIRFNAAPYLLPLFPFLTLFAGRCISNLIARLRSSVSFEVVARMPAAALLLIAAVILWRGIHFQFERGLTLQAQDKDFKVISEMLNADDKIFVHGSIEILVLTKRSNMNPYVFLDWGKDDYLAAGRPAGFSAVVDEMEKQAPKIVALARLQKVTHRPDLINWVDEHYDDLKVPDYDGVYVRKQELAESSR